MKITDTMLESMIDGVEEQIQTRNPIETQETYQLLLNNGYSSKDATKKLAVAIAVESFAIIKTGKPFNRERYIQNLKRIQNGKEPIE